MEPNRHCPQCESHGPSMLTTSTPSSFLSRDERTVCRHVKNANRFSVEDDFDRDVLPFTVGVRDVATRSDQSGRCVRERSRNGGRGGGRGEGHCTPFEDEQSLQA
eukprot:2864877-Rhodomonas_salina.2